LLQRIDAAAALRPTALTQQQAWLRTERILTLQWPRRDGPAGVDMTPPGLLKKVNQLRNEELEQFEALFDQLSPAYLCRDAHASEDTVPRYWCGLMTNLALLRARVGIAEEDSDEGAVREEAFRRRETIVRR
jgi:hypothetical protein